MSFKPLFSEKFIKQLLNLLIPALVPIRLHLPQVIVVSPLSILLRSRSDCLFLSILLLIQTLSSDHCQEQERSRHHCPRTLKRLGLLPQVFILHWFRASHPNITHKSRKRGQILKKDLCIPHWYYIFMEFFFLSPQVITSIDRTVFLGSPGLCWRRELMMLLWNVAPMGGGRGSICFAGLLWESPGFPCEKDNLLSQKSQVSFEEGCLTAIYSVHAYQKK